MSPRKHPPTRTLRERPDLDQLKRQAKDLLKAFVSGDAAAAAEVEAHYHDARPSSFALHDAQLVIARAYGFDSWPKLKTFVDGVTVERLFAAIRDGDLAAVSAMLEKRPELVNYDRAENDEHKALHVAVLHQHPAMVRLLMRHGADARRGIWPHRGATGALTIAEERGYDEIAAIIRDEERRRETVAAVLDDRRLSELGSAFAASDEAAIRTARSAIDAGDGDWLRAAQAAGTLAPQGLLSHAVGVDRPDMLRLLLDLGLDPDESDRVGGLDEFVPTFGAPLRECALAGKLDMADILLAHGANPNTNVYAASSALLSAYSRRDVPMIALLERHGARLDPISIGDRGLTARAEQLLAEAGVSVAPDLLWGAIGCPSPAIVRLALDRLDWPRGDHEWHRMLENGLYLGPQSDRVGHLEVFRLVLARSGPDVRSRLGATLLHDITASRGGLTAADRTAYATMMLDAGARLDPRDQILKSTPLGWACRWGRIELVTLFLERGADPIERDAEPWATPLAWAIKKGRADVIEALR